MQTYPLFQYFPVTNQIKLSTFCKTCSADLLFHSINRADLQTHTPPPPQHSLINICQSCNDSPGKGPLTMIYEVPKGDIWKQFAQSLNQDFVEEAITMYLICSRWMLMIQIQGLPTSQVGIELQKGAVCSYCLPCDAVQVLRKKLNKRTNQTPCIMWFTTGNKK